MFCVHKAYQNSETFRDNDIYMGLKAQSTVEHHAKVLRRRHGLETLAEELHPSEW